MAFLDLVLLAAIAGFLGYRLWVVLGTYDADKPINKKKPAEEDVVVRTRSASSRHEAEEEHKTVNNETAEEEKFLQGASIAFYKIVEAYAAGDISTLEKLLENPLLETFKDAIAKRDKAKKKLEVDIARIVTAEKIDSREEKGIVYATVRFVSEQCLVTKNMKGKVVEGDPDRYVDVTDIWTFSRSLKSSNPNWKLIATQVSEA